MICTGYSRRSHCSKKFSYIKQLNIIFLVKLTFMRGQKTCEKSNSDTRWNQLQKFSNFGGFFGTFSISVINWSQNYQQSKWTVYSNLVMFKRFDYLLFYIRSSYLCIPHHPVFQRKISLYTIYLTGFVFQYLGRWRTQWKPLCQLHDHQKLWGLSRGWWWRL